MTNRGIGVITGDVGVGKSTLVRTFTSRLATGSFNVLYAIPPTPRSPLRPLVEDLLTQLGKPLPFNNGAKGLKLLKEALADAYDRNRLPVVVIDNAPLLDAKALSMLKVLANYDMDSKLPLSLLLVGSPQLLRLLAMRELEDIRQRLLFAYQLRGLRKEEVEDYVRTRLKAAGHEVALFPRDVIDELYFHTQGNPRAMTSSPAYVSWQQPQSARISSTATVCNKRLPRSTPPGCIPPATTNLNERRRTIMQSTLSLPTPADPLTDYVCDTGGFMAVDANPYCIRLAHCYMDGAVLDAIEAKPHQIARVIHWVRNRKRSFPDAELTGDRKDRWPPGLLPALVQEFGPICWAPEPLVNQTLREYRRTGYALKFVRAALLAACAEEGHTSGQPRPQDALQRWRTAVLKEVLHSFDPDAFHDDIPF